MRKPVDWDVRIIGPEELPLYSGPSEEYFFSGVKDVTPEKDRARLLAIEQTAEVETTARRL
jgi:hypothetical protein